MERTKNDCFAYENNDCTALTCLFCKDKLCRFYKTKLQLKEQLEQCAERLENLGNMDAVKAIRKQIKKV